jgi:hypothetical protein
MGLGSGIRDPVKPITDPGSRSATLAIPLHMSPIYNFEGCL